VFGVFGLRRHSQSLRPVFSSRSLHPKIPFPAASFRRPIPVGELGIGDAKRARSAIILDSGRGLQTVGSIRRGRALQLFRIESERLKLPAPFGRRRAEEASASNAICLLCKGKRRATLNGFYCAPGLPSRSRERATPNDSDDNGGSGTPGRRQRSRRSLFRSQAREARACGWWPIGLVAWKMNSSAMTWQDHEALRLACSPSAKGILLGAALRRACLSLGNDDYQVAQS
jgi:hypothetical protein